MSFLARALWPLALLIFLTTWSKTASASVTAVHVVSRIDGGAASDAAKRARVDQEVELHVVIEATVSGKKQFYSNASSFVLGKKKRRARPIADAPSHFVWWAKVEPSAETMSNTVSGKFRFEPIDYVESVLFRGLNRHSLTADVRPIATTDRGDGVGTMRFKAMVFVGSKLIASPGKEARAGRGSGGLSRAVHRITIRRDDSYLGFLSELYGQPYIWASAGTTDRRHQSEQLEGSDCADFVVYGWRRMGAKVPYTWTGGLPEYTRKLGRGDADEDGIYRDKRGNPIKFSKIGDLVLFPRHVGVLTEDRGEVGVLDHEDVMMHSYFASPREQTLGDSDYANTWLELRRWK